MSTDKIQKLVDSMEPEEAASAISSILKKLFPLLEEEARLQFVLNLLGEPSDEKLTSLVHL
jgi:hypothetical protein